MIGGLALTSPAVRARLYDWLKAAGVQVDPDIEQKIREHQRLVERERLNAEFDRTFPKRLEDVPGYQDVVAPPLPADWWRQFGKM